MNSHQDSDARSTSRGFDHWLMVRDDESMRIMGIGDYRERSFDLMLEIREINDFHSEVGKS